MTGNFHKMQMIGHIGDTLRGIYSEVGSEDFTAQELSLDGRLLYPVAKKGGLVKVKQQKWITKEGKPTGPLVWRWRISKDALKYLEEEA